MKNRYMVFCSDCEYFLDDIEGITNLNSKINNIRILKFDEKVFTKDFENYYTAFVTKLEVAQKLANIVGGTVYEVNQTLNFEPILD